MLRPWLFASLLLGIFLGLTATSAHAATCPLEITEFALDGRSTTAVAYRLRLGTHDASFAFNFELDSANGKAAEIVLPAGSEAQEALFAWPRSDLQSIRVKSYEPPSHGPIQCTASPVELGDVNGDPMTVVFARGTLPMSRQLLPVEPSVPGAPVFVHQAPADYPSDAARAGASGRVEVLVDVNPEGKPANAVVASSSQYAPLDEAAVAATMASAYKPPQLNGRPAQLRYLVRYAFPMPGASSPLVADTKCHVWITHGWLIGLNRSSGENLYEIELGANRRDIRDVDISLEKGDLSPPINFSKFDWQRQPSGTYISQVYALSAGQLVGSMRLESTDVAGQTLICAPFTIVTWDHSAGRLNLGTPPTIPPANVLVQPSRVALAAVFVRKAWPTYPQTFSGDRSGGIAILAVTVDSAGRPKTTDVFRSSGVDALDTAAVDAAMRSVFRATGSSATYIAWYVFRPTLTMGEYLP